jgi:DUF177 domain-containing protein
MFIEISELERHPVDFEEELAAGTLDLGPDLQQSNALNATGRAQLVEEHHGKHRTIKDIRVNGQLSSRVEACCGRCLEPVTQGVSRTFDLLYRPQGIDAGTEERSVATSEAEISYYQGEGILLEDVLREQVLLALPLKILCHEDCRGLCAHCGKNLNVEQCSCTVLNNDPRWAALKDLKEKLQH